MADRLPALTVKQPWAWAIAHAGKRIENRSWRMDYRGDLAIHAGAYSGWDKDAETNPVAIEAWKRWVPNWTTPGLPPAPLIRGEAYAHFTFGAVIAVALAAGCHHSDDCMHAEYLVPPGGFTGCSPWAVRGQWHIELAGVRLLADPVPCRGRLGLWWLPEDAEKAVRAVDRYGVSTRGEQYTGWSALPASRAQGSEHFTSDDEAREWMRKCAAEENLTAAGGLGALYKQLAKRMHPDAEHGSADLWERLDAAATLLELRKNGGTVA